MGRKRAMRIGGIAVVLALVFLAAEPAHAAVRANRRPGPLRVLLLGDSLTRDYESVATPQLQAKGYQVIEAGVPGRGLLDSNQCHGDGAWTYLNYFDPDIVVVEFTGNYGLLTGAGLPSCTPVVELASKAFFKQWKKSAKLNQRILTKKKARLLWVLNPVVNPHFDKTGTLITGINDIYRKIAKSGLVDAWTGFGGSHLNPALHSDGLHLSDAGKARMASLVVAAIG